MRVVRVNSIRLNRVTGEEPLDGHWQGSRGLTDGSRHPWSRTCRLMKVIFAAAAGPTARRSGGLMRDHQEVIGLASTVRGTGRRWEPWRAFGVQGQFPKSRLAGTLPCGQREVALPGARDQSTSNRG